MKKGSSSAAANGGGNSLAIAERQKAAPSCVAALFQMLAKRKLFSSSSKKNKLLPNSAHTEVVACETTRRRREDAGGQDETSPGTVQLDSADYARSKSDCHGTSRLATASQDDNCSKMSTPGVVARLMGLSSMPATSNQRPAAAMDSSELGGGHRNECSQGYPGTYGSMATMHQKKQKQGQQQLTDERHGDGSQLNADAHGDGSQLNADAQAWCAPGRRRHRVASPLKSPRSISSRNKARLIEAVARVLEPGLQSRNRHPARRHARLLEYSCDGDGVASASDVSRNLPGQCSRNMCIDVDVPMSGARNIGATSLHNSTYNQWSEENGRKNATVRRTNQNVSCQVQPEGNSQGLHVRSSSEKARLKNNVQISNTTADTYQDFKKIQPRNISRGNVTCSPLKQNNLKQNALPVACKAENPGHLVQKQKHRTGERIVADTAKDLLSLNRSMDSSTSLRSKGKTMDRVGASRGSAENKNLSTKGRRPSGLHSDSSNKLKLRTEPPRAMENDMIIAKGAGLVSEKPKSASPNCVRNDFRRQVELHNVSRSSDGGIVSFTFSSPMKADPSTLSSDNTKGTHTTVLGSPNGTCPKRRSCKDYQNISLQRELGFRESVSFNRDECKNRDTSGGRVTSSLTEKTSSVPPIEMSPCDELLWQCNLVDSLDYGFGELPNPLELCETLKKHKANAEDSNPSRSIPRGNNQPRPVSILQSTYADEDSVSGSPHCTTEAGFNGRRRCYSETSTPPSSMQGGTAESNSSKAEPIFGPLEPAAQGNKLMIHPGEVTSTVVELLLTNVCSPGQQILKAPHKAFLLRTSESALATMITTTSTKSDSFKAMGADPLRRLASDFVMECLDSTCIQLCDSGYMSFTKLALICTKERLAAEVRKEMARYGAMVGKPLDDLAASNAESAVQAGMSSLHEALRIGAQIERDLLQELVEEIGLDMLQRL